MNFQSASARAFFWRSNHQLRGELLHKEHVTRCEGNPYLHGCKEDLAETTSAEHFGKGKVLRCDHLCRFLLFGWRLFNRLRTVFGRRMFGSGCFQSPLARSSLGSWWQRLLWPTTESYKQRMSWFQRHAARTSYRINSATQQQIIEACPVFLAGKQPPPPHTPGAERDMYLPACDFAFSFGINWTFCKVPLRWSSSLNHPSVQLSVS